ncbi:MAG: AmmeMemoRadiSam system protein B [Magnetococcales bacterium]|nr:AmmeMemoRadiSam system protein B [Magnetococcales bacterium]
MATERVRPPAVAGMFYPGDAKGLRGMIQTLLRQARSTGEYPPPRAMVAPHAGYVYSGYTAAHAYGTLQRATPENPRRVFVLSPSHRVYLSGVSVGDFSAFATPLGVIEVDQAIVDALALERDVSRDPSPHLQEHALEVHLPFLQETLGHFRLVPMVYGELSGKRLADLVAAHWQPEDLIVASSDLSHFHAYDEARTIDQWCTRGVLEENPDHLDRCEACGKTAIAAVMELARRHRWQPTLADYRNSGDTAGDKSRVVGYASYLFHDEAGGAAVSGNSPSGSEGK